MMDEHYALSDAEPYMPSQWYEKRKRTPEFEPIQRLFAAMLEDAIRCVQLNPVIATHDRAPYRAEFHCKRLHEEAREWILHEGDIPGAISFEMVAEGLGMNADEIREGLRKHGFIDVQFVRRAPTVSSLMKMEATGGRIR